MRTSGGPSTRGRFEGERGGGGATAAARSPPYTRATRATKTSGADLKAAAATASALQRPDAPFTPTRGCHPRCARAPSTRHRPTCHRRLRLRQARRHHPHCRRHPLPHPPRRPQRRPPPRHRPCRLPPLPLPPSRQPCPRCRFHPRAVARWCVAFASACWPFFRRRKRCPHPVIIMR